MFGTILIKKTISSAVHGLTGNKDLAKVAALATAAGLFVVTCGASIVEEVIDNGFDVLDTHSALLDDGQVDPDPGRETGRRH